MRCGATAPLVGVNGLRPAGAQAARDPVQFWWQAAASFLHVVVNEIRLPGFQRFGRASFQSRSIS
jgi:hypothetical protein